MAGDLLVTQQHVYKVFTTTLPSTQHYAEHVEIHPGQETLGDQGLYLSSYHHAWHIENEYKITKVFLRTDWKSETWISSNIRKK